MNLKEIYSNFNLLSTITTYSTLLDLHLYLCASRVKMIHLTEFLLYFKNIYVFNMLFTQSQWHGRLGFKYTTISPKYKISHMGEILRNLFKEKTVFEASLKTNIKTCKGHKKKRKEKNHWYHKSILFIRVNTKLL